MREQLVEQGYCVVPGILSPALLGELREITDRLVDGMSEEHARTQRSTGSMIPVVSDHRLVPLISHRPALDAMEGMGFTGTRFQSGYIISKPPKSPRLFWHFDWGFWDHPMSYEQFPAQVFFMYYLTDTTRGNGCLRVIPGSHIVENPLHELLANAHSDTLTEARDLSRIEFLDRPDEIDLPIAAGDLLVGDSRILHASHANDSDARRTVITLWFHPSFDRLPGGMKAGFLTRRDPLPAGWPAESRRLYESLLIRYEGSMPATPFSRRRPFRGATPGEGAS